MSTACSGVNFWPAEETLEVLALQVLHGDEFRAAGDAEVENADHVAVRDLPGKDEFLFEALQDFLVTGQFGAYYFQGDRTVEFPVMRFVNGAHAAFS